MPRVLLSDGTEPEAATAAATPGAMDPNTLAGTPASAGTVTALARVVLDPAAARLEPGEILVAPSTDPGWTPLFLTAGGLVMEMGGANSHGAVVAREYGIPAVVGVPRATELMRTGDEITVDGAMRRRPAARPRPGAGRVARFGVTAAPARRRGRPPGEQNTRDRVLAAARRVFTEKGYEAAGLRQIARDAGVDAGMVRHYFADKAGLFRAAMELPIDPAAVITSLIADGLDGLGERLIRQFLREWDRAGEQSAMIILVRSAMTHDESTRMLREFISSQVLGRLAAAVDAPDRDLRASLIGSQIVGLVVARYIVRVEPLASADHETVVAAVAPTVQRYLTGAIARVDHARRGDSE